MPDYQLQGKVAVITGGASGQGRAAALVFAREGAKVAVLDFNLDGANEVVEEITSAGGEAIAVAVDVSDEAQVKAAMAQVVETYGTIDCAANCAGVAQKGERTPVDRTPTEEFDRVVGINLRGLFLSMKYELEVMVAQGSGSVVNIASVSGLVAAPNISPYVTSKFGVIGLTQTAALENAARGVRVNAIAPGGIATPLMLRDTPPELLKVYEGSHPSNRLGTPEEIAETIVFMSSPLAGFMMGSVVVADGGYTSR